LIAKLDKVELDALAEAADVFALIGKAVLKAAKTAADADIESEITINLRHAKIILEVFNTFF